MRIKTSVIYRVGVTACRRVGVHRYSHTPILRYFIFVLVLAQLLNSSWAAESPVPNPDTDPFLAAVAANDPKHPAAPANPVITPVSNPIPVQPTKPVEEVPAKTVITQAAATSPLPMIDNLTPTFKEAASAPSPARGNLLAPTPATAFSAESALEEGKALYDNGQYVAALDKFMQVLRRDPSQVEARQYLNRVMDKLRSKRSTDRAVILQQRLQESNSATLSDEVRQRVKQRQLFTMDLAAIPGVRVKIDDKKGEVQIDSNLLFSGNSGGLKEEGIPVLDRVAVWLKTFGQQPITIHCYPEELQDAASNDFLFLHRFAQLYGFFADERKLPAARFVNSGILKPLSGGDKPPEEPKAPAPKGLIVDPVTAQPEDKEPQTDLYAADATATSGPARVVITSIGGGAGSPNDLASSRATWLEFSILPTNLVFSPDEGAWTSLDLSALSHKGVDTWSFKIVPEKRPAEKVLVLEGKGNLLKRVSWDGRNEKTGSFVPAGRYVVKLTATDTTGSKQNKEVTLQVQRSGVASVANASKKSTKPALSSTKTEKPLNPAKDASIPPTETSGDTPVQEDTDNSDHAIWKQVIQFDPNESDLKPTLKASLERIGKTLEVYPMQKVRVMGFAQSLENNPAGLAKQRAEMVRDILINEYQVDLRRVIISGGKVGQSSKVEISITN